MDFSASCNAGISCPHKPACEPCFLRLKGSGNSGGGKGGKGGKGAQQGHCEQRGQVKAAAAPRAAALPLVPEPSTAPALARLLQVSKLRWPLFKLLT